MLLRVLHDDLEYDGDFLCLKGELFTGISYELFENGKLKAEYEYKDGFENNQCRGWYSNGNLRNRFFFKDSVHHGMQEEFYEDGSRKSESNYDLGIEVERKSWSKSGELTEHWTLDPDRHQDRYQLLLERRKEYAE